MKNPFNQYSLNNIFKIKSEETNILITRENNTLEFKQTFNWANKAQYGKTICAYANREGGYIIYGIKDSPHEIIGLLSDNFQNTDEEKITSYLNEMFSPEINWEKTTVVVAGKTVGVLYVYEANNKPVISKKNDGDIKEAEIYYRYRGRSEKIKYPELNRLINNELEKTNKLWIRHMENVTKAGIKNIAVLDTDKGKIEGQGGTVYIDEESLKNIEFIKEGQFDEVEGAKTLKLIGEVSAINGSTVLPMRTKYINIGRREMYESLLKGSLHENTSASEYIEHLIDESSKEVPIYIYKKIGGFSDEDIIKIFENIQTTRIHHRILLINRIKDKRNYNKYRRNGSMDEEIIKEKKKTSNVNEFKSYVGIENKNKAKACALLFNLMTIDGIESVIPFVDEYAKEILLAITYLTKDYLIAKKEELASLLLNIYDNQFQNVASEFRIATCFIDSELYKEE